MCPQRVWLTPIPFKCRAVFSLNFRFNYYTPYSVATTINTARENGTIFLFFPPFTSITINVKSRMPPHQDRDQTHDQFSTRLNSRHTSSRALTFNQFAPGWYATRITRFTVHFLHRPLECALRTFRYTLQYSPRSLSLSRFRYDFDSQNK